MLGPVLVAVIGLSSGASPSGESCPSSEQLLQRLRELGAPVEHLKEVSVAAGAEGAELHAQRDDGTALERPLGEGDCAALTDAASVIVLAWLTRLDGPAPAPVLTAPAPEPVAPPPENDGWAIAAGAGISAWYGNSATWGGDAYVAFAPRGWKLQPELVVFGQGERQIQVVTGYGVWSRLSVAPGLSAVLGSTGAIVRVELGLATGMIVVGGKGFDYNQSTVSYDLGCRAGARLSYGGWPVRPFLGAALAIWGVGHRLDLIPLGQTGVTLPWLDAQLTAGLELAW